jgi:hypothetical protein
VLQKLEEYIANLKIEISFSVSSDGGLLALLTGKETEFSIDIEGKSMGSVGTDSNGTEINYGDALS